MIMQHVNYLRVRGEYACTIRHVSNTTELPPHARRILTIPTGMENPHGTTSACAENTLKTLVGFTHDGNYLRVRGEY